MAKKRYWANEDRSGVIGTSLQEYISCSYQTLVKIFGEPDEENSDGYKVAFEWLITDKDGNDYTIYDYKNTVMYDSDLCTPEELMLVESVDWHIGGTDKAKADVFKNWLENEIENHEDEYVNVTVSVGDINVRLPKRYVDDPENNEDVNLKALVEMAISDNGVNVQAIHE